MTEKEATTQFKKRAKFKKRVKKVSLDIAGLVLLILAFAVAGRLAGGDNSMLPWNW